MAARNVSQSDGVVMSTWTVTTALTNRTALMVVFLNSNCPILMENASKGIVDIIVTQLHRNLKNSCKILQFFIIISIVPQQCEANEFHCDNGRCVPELLTCNHVDDCSDGSDEVANNCKCSWKA